ncbi:retrovirus-related Pol polyprotein from transposon opus [Trichonephila clavipes]|nr:retrovirus-related Pol polyprotein from transposon opus [Trichonephila clavipes]
MKPPRNSKEVSKFLGMSQWYAKFIENYADLCEPLYNLKRKLKKFCWSSEAQKAFDAGNVTITKEPVLKSPNFKKPFELFTNASSIGAGALLNQEQRQVVFDSRTLSGAERDYTVTERECLAVVWALNKFGTYLGFLLIKVITDHATLTRLTHEWQHRPGTLNAVSDVLSRNSVEIIIGVRANCAIIGDLVLLSREQFIEEQRTDSEFGHIYRYLENPEDSSANATIWENWSRNFKLLEDLLFYAKYATSLDEMKVYIPNKKRRTQDNVAASTNRYNLRPSGESGVLTSHGDEDTTEDQFDSGEAEEGMTTSSSKSEQDQATRMTDEDVINNGRTRKDKERVLEDQCPQRSR